MEARVYSIREMGHLMVDGVPSTKQANVEIRLVVPRDGDRKQALWILDYTVNKFKRELGELH